MSKADLLIEAPATIDNNDRTLKRMRAWPEHGVPKGKQSGSDAGECTLCEACKSGRIRSQEIHARRKLAPTQEEDLKCE